MNKVRTSVAIALVAMLAAGVWANFFAVLSGYERPTENELETWVPRQVGDYKMIAGDEDPNQSYKMDELTYEILNPFGIVARVLDNGQQRFDVVIIAGDNADSFHDQRACFRGQGWEIKDAKDVMIETEERGEIPFVLIDIKRQDGMESKAAYAFQGPSKEIYADDFRMWQDFMISELTSGVPKPGYFYRFIPMSQDVTEEELREFIALYMDEAYRYSDGRL